MSVPHATTTTVDCRGQSCPAPILATAKAARGLVRAGGGTLEVLADDDAFPFDIRSWCRSSGSELLELRSADGAHTAVVQVGARATAAPRGGPGPSPALRPPPPAPATVGQVVDLPAVLDCRGQSCPGPILGLARRARALGPGAQLEVVADDPAFRLDLESWCRSSGATVLSVADEGDAVRARLQLAGEPRPAAATARRPVASARPTLRVEDDDDGVVSLQGIDPDERLPWLEQRFAAKLPGERVSVVCDDTGFSVALVQWAAASGHRLLSLDAKGLLTVELEVGPPAASVSPAPEPVALAVRESDAPVAVTAEDRCTLLVLHNDKEALLAALLVAVGAAAQGMQVMMFFTFWGLNLLRGDEPNPDMPVEKVSWVQRMFKWMMPRGPRRQKLGKMDMAGLGRGMLGNIMKRYELMDVPELMATAEEQGVQFVACTMSMQVMGITKRDLAPRENLEYGGVAAFVESAGRSRMSLTF